MSVRKEILINIGSYENVRVCAEAEFSDEVDDALFEQALEVWTQSGTLDLDDATVQSKADRVGLGWLARARAEKEIRRAELAELERIVIRMREEGLAVETGDASAFGKVAAEAVVWGGGRNARPTRPEREADEAVRVEREARDNHE